MDKSEILGLPFCVFAGYSVLNYANGSLTYWLPDRIKQSIGFGKLFRDWVCQVLLELHKNILDFTDFCYLPPSQLKVLNFETCEYFDHLKTNCIKFAHYRLKIRKVIEFFDFQSLEQDPLSVWLMNSLGFE